MVRRKRAGRERVNRYKMQKFDVVIYLVLFFVGLLCLFPLMYVFSVSLTPITEVYENGGFVLIPKEITFEAYRSILTGSGIPRALRVTVGISVVGTFVSVVMTTLVAYPLSRKDLPGRKYLVPFFVFTMLFSGGTIPTYLVVKAVGLTGSYLSLIVPTAVSTYNMLVMKAFYESLPVELSEAARIDGAGEFSVLYKIIIPLSKPVMMTVGLFYLVSYWNTYFSALMYITEDTMQPLQIVLRRLLAASSSLQNVDQVMPSTTLQMAAVIVSCLPVLMIYPFLQKYFTKGMVLGAVKG
mgnify:CR=1 FL=1